MATLCAVQEYPMFHSTNNGRIEADLSEFNDAEEVVRGVAQEYEACESADYVSGCASALCLLRCKL